MAKNNYYEVLQVAQTACHAVIKGAYRALSQQYHPDKNPKKERETSQHMREINEAYAVLSNKTQRKVYDAWLAKQCAVTQKTSVDTPQAHPDHRRSRAVWLRVAAILWLSFLAGSGYWVYKKYIWTVQQSFVTLQKSSERCVRSPWQTQPVPEECKVSTK